MIPVRTGLRANPADKDETRKCAGSQAFIPAALAWSFPEAVGNLRVLRIFVVAAAKVALQEKTMAALVQGVRDASRAGHSNTERIIFLKRSLALGPQTY